MTAAERIKAARALTGLSQVKFAKELGIPRRTVENWESGTSTPPSYVLSAIEQQAATLAPAPKISVLDLVSEHILHDLFGDPDRLIHAAKVTDSRLNEIGGLDLAAIGNPLRWSLRHISNDIHIGRYEATVSRNSVIYTLPGLYSTSITVTQPCCEVGYGHIDIRINPPLVLDKSAVVLTAPIDDCSICDWESVGLPNVTDKHDPLEGICFDLPPAYETQGERLQQFRDHFDQRFFAAAVGIPIAEYRALEAGDPPAYVVDLIIDKWEQELRRFDERSAK